MITQLKQRPRVDTQVNELRARRRNVGRWIYLALLAALFIGLADLFIGPLVRLRADGLVVAEQVSVAVPFSAEIVTLSVTSGARVDKGQELARVRSVELAQTIATLTARNAELRVKRLDMDRQTRVAEAVLPHAEERSTQAHDAFAKIRDFRRGGDVPVTIWLQTLRERAEAEEQVAELKAEIRVGASGLPVVDEAVDDALDALAKLRQAYNEGQVVAPTEGIVGLRTARPGDIVGQGQPILILYEPKPFVLAYLETGTLYEVKPGDRVRLTDGFTETAGTVTEVLPVADQLPAEFQKAFKPRGRSQVARIAVDDGHVFPLFAKVSVSGDRWLLHPGVVDGWLAQARGLFAAL